MKLRIATIAILAVSWLPVRAVENLATLLPEETTVFMSMQDSYLFEKLDQHPLYKPVMGSALTKIIAPWMEQQREARAKADKIYKEETGMSLDELQKVFNGQMAIAMKMDFAQLMLGVRMAPGDGAPEIPKDFFDMVMATKFSGDDALAEKLARAYGRIFKEMAAEAAGGAPLPIAKFPEDFNFTKDEHAGVKTSTWKLKSGVKSFIESPSYAVFDGTLVISLSEQGLRGSLDRAKKGAKSLADSPRHEALAKVSKESDMVAYFDISTVVRSLMNAAAKEGGPGAGQTLTAMRALGIQKLDLLYMTADLSKGRSDMEFGLSFHDNPGIMKVLATDGPGIVPNFLPADADSASHSTIHFDRMLTAIEGLVKEAMPAMGDMIGQQLDEMKKDTGVDIRKDVIGNIGPDVISATLPAVENATAAADDEEVIEPTILGVKVKDRKALELAVATLINKAAPDGAMIEKREYQGATINVLKGMPMGFMFTDDWLFVSMGPQTLIEKIITRMAKGGDDHLFAQPNVKAAFEGLPGGDDGSSYLDVSPTLDRVLGMLSEFGPMAELEKFVNLKDLPKEMNLPLAIGVRQYMDDTAFRVRMHVIEKKK
jgi:hypothetical protein